MIDLPTPAADFRRVSAEGEVRVLSTGRVVRQRPVNLLRLVKGGKVPDHLTAYVVGLVWGSDKEETRSDQERAVEYLDYLDYIAHISLASPVVVDKPKGDHEIAVDDLAFVELQEIRDWALRPHDFQAVKTFPVQQDGNLEPGTEGGQDQPLAQ